jgi:predicted RNA binding protein YcfA (HicA-like mRNA interferase family)
MPKLGPIKRRDLIRYLGKLGFEGLYPGGNHQFMVKGNFIIYIPNPHEGDISKALLSRLLVKAGIDRKVWEEL